MKSTKLAELAKAEKTANDDISKYENEIEQLESEIQILTERRRELNENIMQSGDIAKKQAESRELESKCIKQRQEINNLKKKLFESFSSDAYAKMFCR